MAPSARLIVYAIRSSNQEILVDATDFKVDGLFQNEVSLAIDKQSAEPGDSIKFTVNADPESYVGLLAVDQSVLLLKSGNDITKEIVSYLPHSCLINTFLRWSKMSRNMTQRGEATDLGTEMQLMIFLGFNVRCGILGLE